MNIIGIIVIICVAFDLGVHLFLHFRTQKTLNDISEYLWELNEELNSDENDKNQDAV